MLLFVVVFGVGGYIFFGRWRWVGGDFSSEDILIVVVLTYLGDHRFTDNV